jgi:hypothetical protein
MVHEENLTREIVVKIKLALGATVLLGALVSGPADARMGGRGGGSNMGGTHMSSGNTTAMQPPRTFSPDGKTFSPDGKKLGLNDSGPKKWKKPIDSDNGGGDDPPPKTTGKGTGGGTTTASGDDGPRYPHRPWVNPHSHYPGGPYHGGWCSNHPC